MKRAVLGGCFLLGFLLMVPWFAQNHTSPLIANVRGGTAISLEGTWNIIVDPYETGLGSRFYENAKPAASTHHGAAHSGAGRNVALGVDGFSFSAPILAWNSGLLQW